MGSGWVYGVQVGSIVGFRIAFWGSGWVQPLGSGLGSGFFWGSGFPGLPIGVQVGFRLGSVTAYAKIQRFHTKDIEKQHYSE